jgi:hypothetical protein
VIMTGNNKLSSSIPIHPTPLPQEGREFPDGSYLKAQAAGEKGDKLAHKRQVNTKNQKEVRK